MKNLFKKIGALLVAAVMVLSMCTAVFAEGPTGPTAQIRIKNAGTNARFDYLQVIVPDTQKETGWAFATPAIAAKYKTAFTEQDDQTIIKKMIVLESANTKYKGKVPKATTSQIENALDAVLGDSSIMGAATKAATAPITVTSAGVYAIKGTEDGYAYSAMAAYIAFKEYNTATGVPSKLENKEIEAKKTPTKIEKTSDDSDKVVEIGRQVTYTVTGTVPYLPSTQDRFYKIKDTISGASYNVVKTEGENKGKLEVTVNLDNKDYTKYVTVNNNSFELDLNEFVETNVNANKTITITYGATVTDTEVGNIVIAGDGKNWSEPKYGSKTEKLFTSQISITKKGESEEVLAGAGFKVYKEETVDGAVVKKYAKFDTNKKLAGWTTEEADATEITTGDDGTVTIYGLDLGTYKFKEVTAPEGYSINTTDVSGTIALQTGKAKAESARDFVVENASMRDTKLNSLPSTGGMGTYLFTIIGVVVMAGAAGAFFISRRKGSEE